MEYGIQLYSVRDLTEKNLDDALRQVSALGYRFVEFAGFFGHSAEDVRAMLEKYNLTVSGTHTGWQEIAERFEETVAYHKAIGNRNIIIPGADLSDQAKLDAAFITAGFTTDQAGEAYKSFYSILGWDTTTIRTSLSRTPTAP